MAKIYYCYNCGHLMYRLENMLICDNCGRTLAADNYYDNDDDYDFNIYFDCIYYEDDVDEEDDNDVDNNEDDNDDYDYDDDDDDDDYYYDEEVDVDDW